MTMATGTRVRSAASAAASEAVSGCALWGAQRLKGPRAIDGGVQTRSQAYNEYVEKLPRALLGRRCSQSCRESNKAIERRDLPE